MAGIYLQQEYDIAAGDTETVTIDCTDHLDGTELLSTVDSVTVSSGPTGSTITNEAVSTATYVDAYRAVTVAIGCAAQFKLATTTTTGTYDIEYQVTTDAGRIWTRHVLIHAK